MNIPTLKTSNSDFEQNLAHFESRKAAAQGLTFDAENEINVNVSKIVQDVAENGDKALLGYTRKFDGVSLSADSLKVSKSELQKAISSISPVLKSALILSAERIRKFQESVLHTDPPPLAEGGRSTSLRYSPVDSAAICVPGASASLASSVLMNVVPAAVAGVKRIVMITPPCKDGTVSPDRLAAASIAGADEIYRVFGPQAVAAVAFGTDTIAPVDFIAGPGNIYVATAKKTVFGKVGIDMIAGPSEVAVIADSSADPVSTAAELLSQAEHTDGSAMLITDSASLAEKTSAQLSEQVSEFENRTAIENCLRQYGCLIICSHSNECVKICNRIAPEHLVIMSDSADTIAAQIHHAGAIFLGHHTPVAAGDYIAGPSHTLPTGATARFAGGLTANHFLKSTSLTEYSRTALENDAEKLRLMAESEGLPAHAESVRKRLYEH